VAKPLSKWIMKRYSLLWKVFKEREFNYSEAIEALEGDKVVSIALSELRQFGWLEAKLDPKDARKRLYRLKPPEQAVGEMQNE